MSFFISLIDYETNKKFNFHVTETLISYWYDRAYVEDTFLIELGKNNVNFNKIKCWSDVSPKDHTSILLYSILEFLKNPESKDHLDDLLFCCTSYYCVLKESTNITINYLELKRIKNDDILIETKSNVYIHWPKTPKKFTPKLVVDNDL